MPNSTTTVATTATKITRVLGAGRCGRLTLSLPSTATAAVYTGDSASVTTSTGLPLQPGEERTYYGEDAKKDWWAIVASGTQTLRSEEGAVSKAQR